MKKSHYWEYTVVEVVFENDSIYVRDHERNGSLKELGRDDWELVAVQTVSGKPLAFFKRRREQTHWWAPPRIGKREPIDVIDREENNAGT